MMTLQNKTRVLSVLLLTAALFQTAPVIAKTLCDDTIQHEVERQIGESGKLRSTVIEVHVKERVVVLTGQVWLYEQKLISDRIAWTTPGVFEVDNEIRVIPKTPMSDANIERKIRKIINADEQLRVSDVKINVANGEVVLIGSFLSLHDPSRLKHKVAEIEGVIEIRISAVFFSYLSGNKR
ncbi:MAG: BON domain-containing protein [Candidatus Thiodiazotropha endolucinida]